MSDVNGRELVAGDSLAEAKEKVQTLWNAWAKGAIALPNDELFVNDNESAYFYCVRFFRMGMGWIRGHAVNWRENRKAA